MKNIIFCLLLCSIASAEEIRCPEMLQMKQTAKNVPKGWKAVDLKDDILLVNMEILRDKNPGPGNRAFLVPEELENGAHSRWAVNSDPDNPFWIGCIYQGTTVILLQPVDPQAKHCDAYHDIDAPGYPSPLLRFTCE